MTVIRLRSGELLVHSPCAFDDSLTAEVAALGRVAAIIAPGNLDWLQDVRSCQRAFPDAANLLAPGSRSGPRVSLSTSSLAMTAAALAGELSQVALQGTRSMPRSPSSPREPHPHPRRPRRELHASDARHELIAPDPDSRPRHVEPTEPGTRVPVCLGRQGASARGMERILAWDFERVILSHGDIIQRDARQIVAQAWRNVRRRLLERGANEGRRGARYAHRAFARRFRWRDRVHEYQTLGH